MATTWTLTGIANAAGTCDCCSRAITQRVFQVSNPAGETRDLGRRCAAKATGYKVDRVEREAARAARMAVTAARQAALKTAYPAVAADILGEARVTEWMWDGDTFNAAGMAYVSAMDARIAA